MKINKLLTVCCVLLLAVCVVLSFFTLKKDSPSAGTIDTAEAGVSDTAQRLYGVFEGVNARLAAVPSLGATVPAPAPESTDDTQFKIALLHFYAQSGNIVSILPFTTIQVTEAALLKAFMSSSTAVNEALVYIDRYADRTLASSYETLDELIEKYRSLLEKYNISSSSAYTAKFNRLNSMFSSLKNASTELLSRTRTLIKMSKAEDYDAYYTNYVEQLSDLTGKIEQYCSEINNEYYALLSELCPDYEEIK